MSNLNLEVSKTIKLYEFDIDLGSDGYDHWSFHLNLFVEHEYTYGSEEGFHLQWSDYKIFVDC